MHLSNLAPYSLASFDITRHFTGVDVFFTKRYVKLLIKWSKTFQDSSKAQAITLPKLGSSICPYSALKALSSLYEFSAKTSLFQFKTLTEWVPVTDTRRRKCFKSINLTLGLSPSF